MIEYKTYTHGPCPKGRKLCHQISVLSFTNAQGTLQGPSIRGKYSSVMTFPYIHLLERISRSFSRHTQHTHKHIYTPPISFLSICLSLTLFPSLECFAQAMEDLMCKDVRSMFNSTVVLLQSWDYFLPLLLANPHHSQAVRSLGPNIHTLLTRFLLRPIVRPSPSPGGWSLIGPGPQLQ